jgi:probable DNA repair protein
MKIVSDPAMKPRAWRALPAQLRAALTAGDTVVTPNKRLARRLVALHDSAQRADGRVAWEAAVVLPWNGWLERLWLDVVASGAVAHPPRLITAAQSAFLWRRIVAGDRLPLIDESGLAKLAADAWSIVHAWGAGGPSWRGWNGGDDDREAFVRWAEAFAQRLAASGAIDIAPLPDWLVREAPRVVHWRGTAVTLAGFIEESPQQQRLISALSAGGMRIARSSSVGDVAGVVSHAAAATPRDEVLRALQWARERALADSDAAIAIAIEDLGSRREEIRSLADDVLCPALQWPGHEEAARPYNISVGVPASSIPLLAAALDLIALAHAPLPMPRVAALLRSPYIGAAREDWMRRAGVEAAWLDEGRREIAHSDAIAALMRADPPLAAHWRRARDSVRWPAAATSREWVEAWRAWIEASGWPGDRALSSIEWQARELWDELLTQFAGFAWIVPRITAAEAVTSLNALARDHIFQPQSAAVPIQILGVLEAAGLPFDALWIAGLASDVWPAAPRPNPLLPLAWQRERNAPRATPARELAYAQGLTAQWARGAPEVIFSFARSADDHERSLSLLVPPGTPLPAQAARVQTATRQLDAVADIETIVEDRAPPLAHGVLVRGGASLIAAQSDCPFQAMARFRLRARPWPRPVAALAPWERGKLVHAALAAFWRDARDHATLVALSPEALQARIDAAANAALAEIATVRWREIPAAVRAGESLRTASLVRAWIDAFERPRAPFSIDSVEVKRGLVLAGLALELRIDRIDRLAGEGIAIIDYKTGPAKAPGRWFDPRPQAPQIGLYVLAERERNPDLPIRAAAYPQLQAGDLNVRGIAADRDAWPGLRTVEQLARSDLPDWDAVEAHWRRALEALGDEVREGHASVTPRDTRTTCRICRLQALCRIGALAPEMVGESGDG